MLVLFVKTNFEENQNIIMIYWKVILPTRYFTSKKQNA